jgi:hypothetical protein
VKDLCDAIFQSPEGEAADIACERMTQQQLHLTHSWASQCGCFPCRHSPTLCSTLPQPAVFVCPVPCNITTLPMPVSP